MKTIVLCGSMKIKDNILNIGAKLEPYFNIIYPEEIFKNLKKSDASRRHFNHITSTSTDYILVVNDFNHGVDNYIGPNSLCEISFGFYFNKKVYLLNDYYEPYKDELKGWHVIPLKGNLNKLIKNK